jgi:2-hydroxychromene-2-carboxylate isomerase/catechol 2,3-dioxygenase-like lactoylglutathione lyase family enzyme
MRVPAMKSLTFYLDFISPYAYLGWTQIHALAARHDCEVVPEPILFAALLDANGQKGPAEIPSKRVYTFKDVTRSAHRLGVPIAAPASHPFNPLLALRVASADLPADRRRALVDTLFAATWQKSVNVSDPTHVSRLLEGAGFDGARLVEWAGSAEAKERVKKTTARALEAGAFGVPTMVVEGELFWGLDSFANLERWLEGKDPLKGTAGDPWKDVVASANRPSAGAGPAKGPYTSTRDIIVRTDRLEEAARFYEKTLGFRPTMQKPHMLGFETGAFQLFVEKGSSRKAPHGPVFDLRTRDATAAKEALLAAGCRVVEEDPSVPRCYLEDPFGFVFNLEGG